MQMCRIMIKINNYLKLLKIDTDVEVIVPEGPHNELIVKGFPRPPFMTPQCVAIANQEGIGCFFKIWVLLCGDANEAQFGNAYENTGKKCTQSFLLERHFFKQSYKVRRKTARIF